MYFLCYGHGLFSTICIRIAYYCVGTRIIEAHFPELSMLYILFYIFSLTFNNTTTLLTCFENHLKF